MNNLHRVRKNQSKIERTANQCRQIMRQNRPVTIEKSFSMYVNQVDWVQGPGELLARGCGILRCKAKKVWIKGWPDVWKLEVSSVTLCKCSFRFLGLLFWDRKSDNFGSCPLNCSERITSETQISWYFWANFFSWIVSVSWQMVSSYNIAIIICSFCRFQQSEGDKPFSVQNWRLLFYMVNALKTP